MERNLFEGHPDKEFTILVQVALQRMLCLAYLFNMIIVSLQ